MPQGSKEKYSAPQKAAAGAIRDNYVERYDVDRGTATEIAWRTVNKQWGGGANGGSGMRPSERRAADAMKSESGQQVKSERYE